MWFNVFYCSEETRTFKISREQNKQVENTTKYIHNREDLNDCFIIPVIECRRRGCFRQFLMNGLLYVQTYQEVSSSLGAFRIQTSGQMKDAAQCQMPSRLC